MSHGRRISFQVLQAIPSIRDVHDVSGSECPKEMADIEAHYVTLALNHRIVKGNISAATSLLRFAL